LVLRFALFAALGLAAAAVVIVGVVRQAYAAQGEQRAISQARLTAGDLLQAQLRPSDLTRPVPIARRRQLNRVLRRDVLANGTVAVALYTARGVPTYSTGRGSRARKAEIHALIRKALGGSVIARIDPARSGRVLSIYVPVAIGSSGTRGVLALERDYAPIAAATRRSSLLIAGALEGALLALFLLVLPMLARASARIRAQVDALDRLATHDELTGLANRAGFRRALDQLSEGATAQAAVMLVDLESFHEINDTLGPERGDRLLVKVAARLGTLEGCELVARLGEDEFGLLLPGADDDEIARVAQGVRQALANPIDIGGQRVAVEARIGCAQMPHHGTEPEILLRRAGVALSVAKETRVDVEIYDPDHDASDISRLNLAAELRVALREGQLTVHYQVQADLATSAIRGAEALVRWQHPRRGLLTAAEFIPAAEQTGLIGEIGRFVLEEAARQWQEWKALGIVMDIAVNLTAVDLLDPQLPDEIQTLLARYGLPAEYLVLEITERSLLRDERHTKQALEQLHRLGARLSVDDYGTGYSSLAYLRNLRAHQVKLDGTFTQGIPGDPADEAIVRSTIELAHKLGATVVAEGVETPEQWHHLADLGCDIAQGYLIGRPVPADELTRRVSSKPALRVVAA
jgi:diguanylate cyclase (GGDEF)-like protein